MKERQQKRKSVQLGRRIPLLLLCLILVVPVLSRAQVKAWGDEAVGCSAVPLTVNVLGNDDIRGCSGNSVILSLSSSIKAHHGRVVKDVYNNLVYTSDSSWSGQDSLQYTIECNGRIDSAVVLIEILPQPSVHAINHVYCDSTVFPTYYFVGDVPGTKYLWSRVIGQDVDSIGLRENSGEDFIPSFIAKNKGIYPLNPWYQVTPVYTRNGTSCKGNPENFLITVNPVPKQAEIADQYHCSGDRVGAYEFTGDVPDAHYAWRYIGGDSLQGLLKMGSNQLPSYIAVNDSTRILSARYEVSPSYAYANRVCSGVSDTFSIHIRPREKMSSASVLAGICSGQSIKYTPQSQSSGVVYRWERELNAGINEVPKQGTGIIEKDTLTNHTNQIVNVRYKITMETGFCSYEDYVSVPVYPSVRMTNASKQNSCSGVELKTLLTSNVSGSSYQWTRLPNAQVKEATKGGTTAMIADFLTNVGTTSTEVKYEIKITAYGCSQNQTDTMTIVLGPSLKLDSDTTLGSVCSGGLFSRDLSSLATGVSYLWEREYNKNIQPYSGSGTGATLHEELYNYGTKADTAVYGISLSNASGCKGYQQIKVVVNPLPDVLLSPSSLTMAINGRRSIAVTGGMSGLVSSSDSTVVKAELNAAKDSIIITSKKADTATVYYTVTDGKGCSNTNKLKVQVTNSPLALLSLVGDKSVCNGGKTTLEITEILHGSAPWTIWLNYQDSASTNTRVVINTKSELPKRVEVTLPKHDSASIQSYYFEIDSIIDGNQSKGSSNSGYIKVEVLPVPTVNAIGNQDLCNGSMSNAIYFTGRGNSYNWTVDKNIGSMQRGNGSIPSFRAMSGKTTADTATITVTSSYVYEGLECVGTQTTGKIIVQPMPVLNTVNDTILCSDTSNVVTINFKGSSVTEYRWTGAANIGLSSGTNGSRMQFKAKNFTSQPVSAQVEVTPVYKANGKECYGESKTFTITVNPSPKVSMVSDRDYCSGTTVSAYTFVGNTPGAQYSWRYINGDTLKGLPMSGASQLPGFLAENNTKTIKTASYEVTASYAYGSVLCSAMKDTFNISVQPQLSVGYVSSKVYCPGDTTSRIELGSDTSAIVYQWKQISGLDLGLSRVSGANEIPSFKAVNATSVAQTAVFEVSPVSKTGRCTGQSIRFEMVVNPSAKLTSPKQKEDLCSGSRFDYQASSNTHDVYYLWNRVSDAGINGGNGTSGQGAKISEILVNDTDQAIEVIYEIRVGYEGCSNLKDTVRVKVNPSSGISLSPEVEICYGSRSASIPFQATNPSVATYYKMSFNTKALEAGFQNMYDYAMLSDSTVQVMIPSDAAAGSYSGTVSTQSAGCTSSAIHNFVIMLMPRTAITTQPQSEMILCNTDKSLSMEVEATGAYVSYQWYKEGEALTGSTGSVYEKSPVSSSDYGVYTVKVMGSCDTVTSETVKVRQNEAFIEQKWEDVLFVSGRDLDGNKLEFKSYQWYREGQDGKLTAIAEKSNSQYYTEEGISGTFVAEVFYIDGRLRKSCPYTLTSKIESRTKIYPNPVLSGNTITILEREATEEALQMEIYDMKGRKVEGKILIKGSEIRLNVSTGTYLLKLTDSKGNVTVEKLVVK